MSTDTEREPVLSDFLPTRGSYRVLADVPGAGIRCVMDGAWETYEEASTHAGIAATQFDVTGTEVIFDHFTNPDEEF